MSRARHTPGPWADGIHHARTEGGRTFAYITNGNDLVPVAVVPLGVEGFGREEGAANARLIAAAPEMLDVLKRAIAVWDAEVFDEAAANAVLKSAIETVARMTATPALGATLMENEK